MAVVGVRDSNEGSAAVGAWSDADVSVSSSGSSVAAVDASLSSTFRACLFADVASVPYVSAKVDSSR